MAPNLFPVETTITILFKEDTNRMAPPTKTRSTVRSRTPIKTNKPSTNTGMVTRAKARGMVGNRTPIKDAKPTTTPTRAKMLTLSKVRSAASIPIPTTNNDPFLVVVGKRPSIQGDKSSTSNRMVKSNRAVVGNNRTPTKHGKPSTSTGLVRRTTDRVVVGNNRTPNKDGKPSTRSGLAQRPESREAVGNRNPVKGGKGQASSSSALVTNKIELTGSFRKDSKASKSNSDDDGTGSLTSFVSDSSSDHDIASPENNTVTESMPTSPTLRKMRTRTMESPSSPLKHIASLERVKVASCERARRGSDSMLEDAVIANKLKCRLGARREQMNRMTVSNAGLSDFIMNSIMEGSLNAVSAALPTCESLSIAVDMAFRSVMVGYFDHIDDEDAKRKLEQIFMESLERMEFRQGEYLFRQNEKVDRLFVIEEGMVQFSCEDQVAGVASSGSIVGELNLVYGIPATADVRCTTSCVMWVMDDLSFRRVQAVVAKESLKASCHGDQREAKLDILRKQISVLSDFQEEGRKSKASDIPFERLERVTAIGQGAFGLVYIVEDTNKKSSEKNCYYCLKCMSKNSVLKNMNENRVWIEKNALQDLAGSPFVISLLGTYQDRDSIYLLTEFVQGGDLRSYIWKQGNLSQKECQFFSANIFSALSHLHRKGFVHRDLKPENCLIGTDGYLKLCDLGLAKRLPSIVQLPSGGTEVLTLAFTLCGTPEYMAPEMALSQGHNKSVDWWDLGCVLVEMYCGRAPFEFNGNLEETFKWVCSIGMGKEDYKPSGIMKNRGMTLARDLAVKLLAKASDRLGRDGSRKVQEHEYFSGIDFEKLERKELKAPYIPRILRNDDWNNFDVDYVQTEEIEPFYGDDDVFKDF